MFCVQWVTPQDIALLLVGPSSPQRNASSIINANCIQGRGTLFQRDHRCVGGMSHGTEGDQAERKQKTVNDWKLSTCYEDGRGIGRAQPISIAKSADLVTLHGASKRVCSPADVNHSCRHLGPVVTLSAKRVCSHCRCQSFLQTFRPCSHSLSLLMLATIRSRTFCLLVCCQKT
jgi:hypothetical protein